MRYGVERGCSRPWEKHQCIIPNASKPETRSKIKHFLDVNLKWFHLLYWYVLVYARSLNFLPEFRPYRYWSQRIFNTGWPWPSDYYAVAAKKKKDGSNRSLALRLLPLVYARGFGSADGWHRIYRMRKCLTNMWKRMSWKEQYKQIDSLRYIDRKIG